MKQDPSRLSSRPRRLRQGLAASAVASFLWYAGGVRASERGAALNWIRLSGAETCIGAAELAERVEARLERSVFVADSAAALSVDGFVQPSAAGFTVRLQLTDRAGRVLGERAIQSTEFDCRNLDEAVVLVIALTLSPDQGVSAAASGIALDEDTERLLHELFEAEPTEIDPDELQKPVEREENVTAVPPPTPSRAVLAPKPRPEPAFTRTTLNASVAGIVALGQLPGAAPGVEVAFTWRPANFWALRLAAAYLPAHTRRAVTLSSGETRFDLSQAAVGLCPWHANDDQLLRMQLCAGLGLSLLHVVAVGYAEGSGRRTDPLLDGQVQFDLQLSLGGPALLQLGVGLAVPFIQHSYAYQGLDGQPKTLFRMSQASGRLGIGLGVGF